MIDDAFGHWVAGFIDGEGHFAVYRKSARGGKQGGQYSCRFALGVREDDMAILLRIRDYVGIGSVVDNCSRVAQNPQRKWTVQSKPDCLALVDFLDQHPLHAKKARDYAIWREAVMEWSQVPRPGSGPRYDWTRMAARKAALEKGRRYRPDPQLALV